MLPANQRQVEAVCGARDRRQREPEVVTSLRCAGHARDVLMPQLVAARDGKPGGRAVQDMYDAGAIEQRIAKILIRHAYRQVGVAIAVEVACGQGATELIVRLPPYPKCRPCSDPRFDPR